MGWPGVHVEEGEDRDALVAALERFNCVPVFLAPQMHADYYEGFCQGVLWPLMHNVVDVLSDIRPVLDDTMRRSLPPGVRTWSLEAHQRAWQARADAEFPSFLSAEFEQCQS